MVMMSTMGRLASSESARARDRLGRYWGLDRALDPLEFARVLRMSGETAGHTVTKWENGAREMTGPVRLAIDLMAPPDRETVSSVARELGAIRIDDRGITLAGLLRRCGYDVGAVLTQITEEAAEMLREPPHLDATLSAQPSEEAKRNVEVYRNMRRGRRTAARIAAFEASQKNSETPIDPH